MKIKVSRGTIHMRLHSPMASGSGGGDPGGPPKPHAPIAPKKTLWQKLKDWFTSKFGL